MPDGLDDEAVVDDLEEPINESLLVEFMGDIDEFPFQSQPEDEDKKLEEVRDLIMRCMANPNISFDSDIPNCSFCHFCVSLPL